MPQSGWQAGEHHSCKGAMGSDICCYSIGVINRWDQSDTMCHSPSTVFMRLT
jgi:hypothetical protein